MTKLVLSTTCKCDGGRTKHCFNGTRQVDGTIAASFSGGSGTKDDSYQVATARDLRYLFLY